MSDLIKYGRKRSNIKREIEKKLTAWYSSITDERIAKIAEVAPLAGAWIETWAGDGALAQVN